MSLLRMGRVEFTCLKSTIETRKSEIYSELATKLKKKNDIIDLVLVFVLLTLNIFHFFV